MCTVAGAGFLLRGDFFEDQRSTVSEEVLFNGGTGKAEAVADQIFRFKRHRLL